MQTNLRLTLSFLLLTAAILSAMAVGFIPVRNFPQDIYRGGAQNWAVTQDSIGRIYVGNRDGMILYDGQRWKMHVLPNLTTVRSLHFDKETGRIYAAGSDEFGFFSPDSITFELKYTSLSDRFKDRRPNFTEVWNIITDNHDVWFQSDFFLFRYDGNNVISFQAPGRISHTKRIGQYIYLATETGHIFRFDGHQFLPLPGSEALDGLKIVGIEPYGNDGDILFASSHNGLFLYKNGSLSPMDCDISTFLRENQIFSVTSRGDDYVFGTVNRGAVIKNFNTGASRYINKESGMQNNTVLFATFDAAGNIWLALDNGLDLAAYTSPLSIIVGPESSIGAGYASLLHLGRLYFGTNQGLYSTSFPIVDSPSQLALQRELQGQIWNIVRTGESVFVTADTGLFDLSSGSPVQVLHKGTFYVQTLRSNPDLALASTYKQFHLLQRTGGRWTDAGTIAGYDDIGGNFIEDQEGNIWLPHWRKGVYRLRLSADNKSFVKNDLLDENAGFPDKNNIGVTMQGGRPIFSTMRGFYTYNKHANRMLPDKELGNIFGDSIHSLLRQVHDGALVAYSTKGFRIARRLADGSFDIDSLSLRSQSRKMIPGYINLNYIDKHELIVSNQDGFWSIDTERSLRRNRRPAPFISYIYANRDSLIYSAPTTKMAHEISIPYNLNSIRFDFGYPNFSSPANVEFSSFLENYDAEWTNFSSESSREFTQLREGNYTLNLRARDLQSGIVTQTSIQFKITPPWYRSVWAKIFYSILIIAIISGVYKFIKVWTSRQQRQILDSQKEEMLRLRRKAEQENLKKDYQIATLKSEQLELDIKHKSHELSSSTMNLIRKNEILNDIAVKIGKLQKLPEVTEKAPEIKKHLQSIKKDIEANISHDDDWKTFTSNFDIVYENYTKRLLELHPNLTTADKRICCYIKMGLSSKEIGPLINISYKSVEMARYRLRKKINLPPDKSLTEYLQSI